MRTRTSQRSVRAIVFASGLSFAADGTGGYTISRLPLGDWLFNGSLRECDAFMDGWRAHRVFGAPLDADIQRKVDSLKSTLSS